MFWPAPSVECNREQRAQSTISKRRCIIPRAVFCYGTIRLRERRLFKFIKTRGMTYYVCSVRYQRGIVHTHITNTCFQFERDIPTHTHTLFFSRTQPFFYSFLFILTFDFNWMAIAHHWSIIMNLRSRVIDVTLRRGINLPGFLVSLLLQSHTRRDITTKIFVDMFIACFKVTHYDC